MIGLGLEVEAFGESMCGCSSLGSRVRVDLKGRDCESEVSKVSLMVDPWGIASSRVWVQVTSLRVRCGCTVWSFTTLGGCGLSLSLGLRPIKTHSSNQEIRSN